MTHMRDEDRAARHRLSACKRGKHLYGEAQNVGAGIVRRVCVRCAEVTIDLTQSDELKTPLLRRTAKITSLTQR